MTEVRPVLRCQKEQWIQSETKNETGKIYQTDASGCLLKQQAYWRGNY